MKRFVKRAAILLALGITSCNFNHTQVPPDFAIRIEGIFHDELDIFNGIYSRSDIARPSKIQITDGREIENIVIKDSIVSFRLTTQEKQEIYALLQEIEYEKYPDTMAIKCEADIIPSNKIFLKIRTRNNIKCISYNRGCQDKNEQIKAVRRIHDMAMEIASRHKEVREIPETSRMLDM
jgi:hypothetical protein